MRMVIVAGLLMVALLGAVLGSVGAHETLWVSAPNEDNGAPVHEISGQILPGSLRG